jgi:hypothetical protein
MGAEDTTTRSERILIDLIPRLARYAQGDRYRTDRQKGLLMFWNVFRDVDSNSVLEGDEETRFMEWFLFDYRTRSGRRLWERFLEDEPATDEEMRVLRGLESAHLSLLEVRRSDAGGGTLLLEDLFTGRRHEVGAPGLAPSLERDEILFGRVLVLDGKPLLTGAPSALPAEIKEPLREFMREKYETYRREVPGSEWPDFLKREGYLINHFLAEYVAGFATEREGRLFHMLYAVESTGTADRLLQAEDDFDRDPHRESCWLWTNRNGEAGGWVALGRETLSFYSTTREDFSEGTETLESLLGTSLSDAEDLTDWAGEPEILPVPRSRRAGEAAEGQRDEAAMLQSYDDYYERWIDTPVPDLDDRTPRDLSRSASGRRRLELLVDRMEFLQLQRALDHGLSYDFDRLRRKLGLPVPSSPDRRS